MSVVFDSCGTIDQSDFLYGGVQALSARAKPGEGVVAFVRRVQEHAASQGLRIFNGMLFGDPALAGELGSTDWPVSFLGRHDVPKGAFFGGRFEALPEGKFQWVVLDGQRRGAVWEDEAARYLWAGALVPQDTKTDSAAQSQSVWDAMQSILSAHGFGVRQIVRTWFYNSHILDWYKQFNDVRTAFFKKHAVFGNFVPASTGIGADNQHGAALLAHMVALAPKDKQAAKLAMAPSPLQCPAYDYKSAFSRGATCDFKDGRALFVSGTASIEPGGKSAHPGDLDKQIDLTLCVIAAILKAANMQWADVCRGIAYFPKIEWMDAFEKRLEKAGIQPFPVVYAHSDVCRGDLMFELEVDAVKRK